MNQKPGQLVISLDFELFWGVRDHRKLHEYRDTLLGVRQAIPAMLELFEEYGIRASWATVGFLFCNTKDELLATLPRRLPAYHHLEMSPYAHIAHIGENEEEDPYHYAPSLIDAIAAAPGQEIASHTYSHYYCMEEGQDALDFEADLRAAVEIARHRGIMLRSLVFPRNQVRRDYLGICHRLGISAYRGNPGVWPYEAHPYEKNTALRRAGRMIDSLAPLTGNGCVANGTPMSRQPVNVPATRYFRPLAGRHRMLCALQRRRLFGELDYAARTGGIFHLWWHPHNFGLNLRAQLDELRTLLDRFDGWRRLERMESVTMHEVVAGKGQDIWDSADSQVRRQRHG